MLTRRGFLHTVAATLVAAPPAANAQQAAKVPRIGILWVYSRGTASSFADAFRQGLGALGYVDGRTVVLQERWADGRRERLASLAAELVGLRVDILVTSTTAGAQAAQQATETIPIVMATVSDPVGSGLVTNLARPGGNITGLSLMHPELSRKRLQVLREVVPRVARVAVLSNPSNPIVPGLLRETEAAARSVGVQLHVVNARSSTELDAAFSAMSRQRAGALLVVPDAVFQDQRTRIVALAERHRLPALYPWIEPVTAGGLMSYGASIPDLFRQAAGYVDKILKGAKPADLPIEQPTKFELAINLRTAKALGLTIPQSLLLSADHVIP